MRLETRNFAMLALIAASVVGCSRSSGDHPKEPSASETNEKTAASPAVVNTPSVVDTYKKAMPASEVEFLAIIKTAELQYSQSENEMKGQLIRIKRGKEICAALPKNYSVKNWTGKFLTAGNAGMNNDLGYVNIMIDDKVSVTTSNYNTSATMMNPESSIFKKVSELKYEDQVKFSGRFVEGYKSEYDCIKMDGELGDMSNPDFIMEFSSIEKLELP